LFCGGTNRDLNVDAQTFEIVRHNMFCNPLAGQKLQENIKIYIAAAAKIYLYMENES
jgi:hypothetical protein